MAENTKIQWTDHTFNPWWGCTKVSSGCAHCYAEELSDRYKKAKWGDDGERAMMSEAYWKKPEKWNREAGSAEIPAKVFCASMADVFEDRPELDAPRMRLFGLISQTPWLRWMLLTKRPENWDVLVKRAWVNAPCEEISEWLAAWAFPEQHRHRAPHNVAIGTSIENEDPKVMKRIDDLIEIPARTRFLSMEPMIARVDPWDYLLPDVGESGIHMVIVGGESGPKARPFDPEWAREIMAQCKLANVPFFMKQMSGLKPTDDMIPEDLRVREWPEGLTS